MFKKLPDLIDPVHCAEHNMQFHARVNLSVMERLKQQIVSDVGEVSVEVNFQMYRALKAPSFDMKVVTELNLECQVSLQTFKWPVDVYIQGVFLPSMLMADDVDESFEIYELPLDKISLLEMVEDELLLAIPMSPKKDDIDFDWQDAPLEESEQEPQEAKPNPFAELEKLKR